MAERPHATEHVLVVRQLACERVRCLIELELLDDRAAVVEVDELRLGFCGEGEGLFLFRLDDDALDARRAARDYLDVNGRLEERRLRVEGRRVRLLLLPDCEP